MGESAPANQLAPSNIKRQTVTGLDAPHGVCHACAYYGKRDKTTWKID